MSLSKRLRAPSYRLHRPSGQAVVTLNGRDFYLGTHGTNASRAEYDRLIAEWLAIGRVMPHPAGGLPDVTVNELILAYWRHAEQHYRKPDGTVTSEPSYIQLAMRPLRRLYGHTPAAVFGPLALKAVRQAMIDAGLSRTGINARISRIRRMFKWSVGNELVPPGIFQALTAVSGLRAGRTEARETEPVRPVPEEHVRHIRPYVARQIWGIIELQRLTGMRSGEVCDMRGCDLDTTGELWLYRPGSHKTAHHGHTRTIELGSRAQAVIRPFLKADVEAYLFSPRDAEAERHAEQRRNRKTPLRSSQKVRRSRERVLRDHYTKNTYARAIRRACERAGVPYWHPHRLRHSFATRVRREHGLEVARVLLGHRTVAVSQRYAEQDHALATQIVKRIG